MIDDGEIPRVIRVEELAHQLIFHIAAHAQMDDVADDGIQFFIRKEAE